MVVVATASSPSSEWDPEALHRALERGGEPHDEMIILRDGTRLESVEQVEQRIAEMVAIGRSE